MNRFRIRWLFALAVLLTFGLAACDSGVVDPIDDHAEPVAAEVYLRGTEERLAYVHGDHWHGRIELEAGEEIAVDVRFLDEHDQVIGLGGEFTVLAEVAPGHPTGLVDVDGHGDHVDIEALAAGETRILLHFAHDGHIEWSTPALRVVVEPGEPVGAEVILRSNGERVAYTHGDHWHGGLPHIHEGEHLSINVNFLNQHGYVIPLVGDYSVQARLADGAPAGIVALESHGDHLHIHGESEGQTAVVFQFFHDDHADWESPAITVEVEDH
jgi:hypothetical protein